MTSRNTFDPATCQNYTAKHNTRLTTLDQVRQMSQWNGILTRDWVDLCGERDATLRLLLEHGALQQGQGRYIGINNSAAVTEANEAHYAQQIEAGLCRFITCDWNAAMRSSEISGNASILTFDAFVAVQNKRIEAHLDDTLWRAKEQRGRYGETLLYLNLSDPPWRGSVDPLLEVLTGALEHPFTEQHTHRYKSKKIPMRSIWIRMDF